MSGLTCSYLVAILAIVATAISAQIMFFFSPIYVAAWYFLLLLLLLFELLLGMRLDCHCVIVSNSSELTSACPSSLVSYPPIPIPVPEWIHNGRTMVARSGSIIPSKFTEYSGQLWPLCSSCFRFRKVLRLILHTVPVSDKVKVSLGLLWNLIFVIYCILMRQLSFRDRATTIWKQLQCLMSGGVSKTSRKQSC